MNAEEEWKPDSTAELAHLLESAIERATFDWGRPSAGEQPPCGCAGVLWGEGSVAKWNKPITAAADRACEFCVCSEDPLPCACVGGVLSVVAPPWTGVEEGDDGENMDDNDVCDDDDDEDDEDDPGDDGNDDDADGDCDGGAVEDDK